MSRNKTLSWTAVASATLCALMSMGAANAQDGSDGPALPATPESGSPAEQPGTPQAAPPAGVPEPTILQHPGAEEFWDRRTESQLRIQELEDRIRIRELENDLQELEMRGGFGAFDFSGSSDAVPQHGEGADVAPMTPPKQSNVDPSEFALAQAFGSGRAWEAIVAFRGTGITVTTGDRLPGDWRVDSISRRSLQVSFDRGEGHDPETHEVFRAEVETPDDGNAQAGNQRTPASLGF